MTVRAVARQHMPGGEEAQSVFHFFGSLADQQAAEDIATAVSGFYEAFDDQLSNDWFLYQIDVGGVGLGVEYSADVTGVIGAFTGVPAPNDCALVVHWRSSAPGRHGRGRTFLGGWGIDAFTQLTSTSSTVWSGTPLSQVGPAAGALVGEPTANPFGLYNQVAGTFSPVVGGYVSNKIGTQRRRDKDTAETRLVF